MAKRSGCPAKEKPPPSNTFLHCVCADVSLTPRPAQAQRRRAIYIRRRTRGCAGWRHKCLIRPTGPPAGSNSAGPRKRSAAGRYTSDAVPAVMPDGGINALSGLRVLPQAQTAQARASAAPLGDIHQTPYPRLCRMAASMPYPAYGSSRRLQQRRPAQAQRRRVIYIRRRTRGCAGWRHKCLIRPTGPPAGSNSAGPRKRSAAGQGIIEWSSMKKSGCRKAKTQP
ncbi:Uncharacterised protein [Klebsiella quasipneumoniae]|nr:Uncharacterised protein [Klebsiella quasipneumoniae]